MFVIHIPLYSNKYGGLWWNFKYHHRRNANFAFFKSTSSFQNWLVPQSIIFLNKTKKKCHMILMFSNIQDCMRFQNKMFIFSCNNLKQKCWNTRISFGLNVYFSNKIKYLNNPLKIKSHHILSFSFYLRGY